MSASNKKKLRSEQNSQKMTERQLQEQKEAKKLKIYTTVFVTVLALLVLAAACLIVSGAVAKSGVLERNTVAVTVGEHEITSAEMNYFYTDSVLNYCSEYSAYISWILDINTPLDKQVMDPEAGTTWAEYFFESAVSDARNIYSIADAAKAAGFEISAEDQASIAEEVKNTNVSNLKLMYGNGASKESYQAYVELRYLASTYYSKYAEELTYDDAALREAEKDNFNQYSSFSANYKYIPVSNYLEGGTKGEDGTTTYSDEEKAAAQKKAEAVANGLIGETCTSVDSFNDLIAAMEGAGENETSSVYSNVLYTKLDTTIQEWIASADRKEGDKTVIEAATTTTAEDGTETKTVNGYYAVYFVGANDNNYPTIDVRHILIQPEGGTYNASTQRYDYTDDELLAAAAKAQALLDQWKNDNPTEESFAALANANTADVDKTSGGLYEAVYPGQMVTSFNDWCFAEGRKSGDTGVITSEFGAHIMYFVGDNELLYRDHMITEELRADDLSTWSTGLYDAMTATTGNTKYVNMDMIVGQYMTSAY